MQVDSVSRKLPIQLCLKCLIYIWILFVTFLQSNPIISLTTGVYLNHSDHCHIIKVQVPTTIRVLSSLSFSPAMRQLFITLILSAISQSSSLTPAASLSIITDVHLYMQYVFSTLLTHERPFTLWTHISTSHGGFRKPCNYAATLPWKTAEPAKYSFPLPGCICQNNKW